MKTPIRILLVDDHYWIRPAITATLNAAGNTPGVAEAEMEMSLPDLIP